MFFPMVNTSSYAPRQYMVLGIKCTCINHFREWIGVAMVTHFPLSSAWLLWTLETEFPQVGQTTDWELGSSGVYAMGDQAIELRATQQQSRLPEDVGNGSVAKLFGDKAHPLQVGAAP